MIRSNTRWRPWPLALVAVLFVAVAQPVAAQRAFTSNTTFGDSFSDTGNLFQLTGGTQPPPSVYFDGRVSNGFVWTDYLAEALGVPADADPAFASRGNTGNYAIAGARTQDLPGASPSTQTQLGAWFTRPGGATIDPTGLYTIFAGANDIRDAGSIADADTRNAIAIGAAQRVAAGAGFLAANGAQFILMPYTLNLGVVPESRAVPGRSAILSDLTTLFNQTLAQELSGLRVAFGSTTFYDLHLDFLLQNVLADANTGGARYGFTDVTSPCLPAFAPPGASSCDVSLFADGLHPTTAAHQLVADAAYNLVAYDRNVTVPEPSPWALVSVGLIGFVAVRRRRAA